MDVATCRLTLLAALVVGTALATGACRTTGRTLDGEITGTGAQGTSAGDVAALSRSRGSKCLTVACRLSSGEAESIPLLLDTGSDLSVLPGAAAAGLDAAGATSSGVVGGVATHGGRLASRVQRLQLRPAGWTGPADRTPVALLADGVTLDGGSAGILGMAFLDAHDAVIDVGNSRLLRGAAGRGRVDGLSGDPGWRRLTLRDERVSGEGTGLRFVSCLAADGERRLTWLLDSGSEKTLLSVEAAESVGLRTWRGDSPNLVDASGQRVSMRYGTLPDSMWGGVEVARLPVGIVALPSLAEYRPVTGERVDGILGMDFLHRFDAVIDLGGEQLFLRLSD